MHRRIGFLSVPGLVALVAAIAVGGPAAPAAAAGPGSRLATQQLNAVVQLRPHVALPFRAPGIRVVRTFPRLGSELVRASRPALLALAGDYRVAGVTPDRSGRFLGHDYGDAGKHGKGGKGGEGDSVFASDQIGADTAAADRGQGVNVALLDTGVSDTPALNRASGRITDGVDVSRLSAGGDARTSGQFTDGYGHGTFLASLIAGTAVPGSDGHTLGVAPAARIVVVKVANNRGVTSLSEVLAGMDWVAAHARAIQVLNVALAVDPPTAPSYGADPLTAAVEHVRAAGVLVVAAVGNTAHEVGDPGDDAQALTVGAADLSSGHKLTIAPFSGSGVVAGVSKPDVVASGVHVLGLLPSSSRIAVDNPKGWQPNGLFRGSGTSEATAVTSGVAAAWFSAHPGATPLAAKVALRGDAVGGDGTGRRGAGLVQVGSAAATGHGNGHAKGKGNGKHGGHDSVGSGEDTFDSATWQANSWRGGDWVQLLASSWSGPAWSASSWSGATWSASSWSASSWSASSWSASSWSASSWSASSWSASSWSASSWSDYGWGDAG